MANRFLAKGLFPKEIPSCFSSRSAARALAANPAVVPPMNRDLFAAPATFSLVRAGGVRRALSIQNPVLHHHLAELIVGNWPRLKRAMDASPITISAARRTRAQGRAAVPATRWRHVFLKQLELRRRGQYVLLTDLAECYRSIYTHAIAWALEGKLVAQASPNDYNLLGNQIDRAVRNAQLRQTNGLPVGPDSSLVVAEVVLAQVDLQIASQLKSVRGYRFYDDYEFVLGTRAEAEQALAVVEFTCRQFGFHLNPRKTRVEPLPLRLERGWLHEIRAFDFRSDQAGATERLVQFFDLVFEQKAAEPESNVVTFALGKLERSTFTDTEWKLCQTLMYQAVGGEPAAAQQLMKTLDAQFAAGRRVDVAMLEEYISDTIIRHAPLGHSFEVTWCLWGAIRFAVKLSTQAAAALTQSWDDVTALLALDAWKRGLMGAADLDASSYQKAVDGSDLRDEHWLLAYEASVRGWLSNSTNNPIASCPAFSALAAAGVRFYRKFQRARVVGGADNGGLRERFFDWNDDDDDDFSDY